MIMLMRGKTNLKFISLTIGQNGYQLAQNRSDATMGKSIGHNSVIVYPILTFFFLKCSFFEDKLNGDNN